MTIKASEEPAREEGIPAPEITSSGCPFDHNSRDYAANSAAILADLRQRSPLAYTDAHNGFYVATRYADVRRLSLDDTVYSSAWIKGTPEMGTAIPPTPHRFGFIMMNPPKSLAFRKAFMPLFTSAYAKALEPKIRQRARECLDELDGLAEFDIVGSYADRIPALTVMEVLGLDSADWRQYVEFFSHSLSDNHNVEEYEKTFGLQNWVMQSLHDEVASRRASPRDDGLSWIISRPVDDRPMTDDEIVENVMLVMIGGFDTSSSLLSNALLYLSEHPDARKLLRDDPSRIESACEEFLRYFTPVQNLARTVMAETEVAGRRLKVGDRVLLCWASANRDEEAFANAAEVELDRFPNRHLAFGVGSHRCAGSHIARVGFAASLQAFLERHPDFEIDLSRSERYESIGSSNGWFRMILRPLGPGRTAGSGQ